MGQNQSTNLRQIIENATKSSRTSSSGTETPESTRLIEEIRNNKVWEYTKKNTQSWKKFVEVSKFRKPVFSKLRHDVLQNFETFHVNYAIVTLIILAYSIFTNLILLIGMSVICATWFYVTTKKVQLVIKGVKLTEKQFLFLLAISAIVVFIVSGGYASLFFGLGLGFLLATLHAVFRAPEPLVSQQQQELQEVELQEVQQNLTSAEASV
eukprot:c8183_g1_i1.p1 GENE.c8183_g1_i1~~c8183_g1_i1.p1  ORF type:complete len:210 (-),score=62.53 c8183_g1_i1:12-641(-)